MTARGDVLVAMLLGTAEQRKASSARILLATRRNGDPAFGASVVVTRSASSAPSVAMNADGAAVLAWRSRDAIWAVAISRGDRGPIRRLGRAAGPVLASLATPIVAIGPSGDAVVAWWSAGHVSPGTRPGGAVIAAAVRRGMRRFGAPHELERTGSLLGAVPARAAVGADGAAAVTWTNPGAVYRLAVAAPRSASFGAARRLPHIRHVLDMRVLSGRIALVFTAYEAPRRGLWLALTSDHGRQIQTERIIPLARTEGIDGAALLAGRGGRMSVVWLEGSRLTIDAPARIRAADGHLAT